jgi:sugar lactone lactonase YvrE
MNYVTQATPTDGTVTTILSGLNSPCGVATDSVGNVYIADTYNHRIRKIDTNGNASILAGSGSPAFADGTGTSASFQYPRGITVDSAGIVYIADTNNARIRKIALNGYVSTIAGDGNLAFNDGPGATARFNYPMSITVNSSGILYVADTYNHRIRKIELNGVVSTFAGDGNSAFNDGPGTSARFSAPQGISLDSTGNLYVGDTGNHRIRKIETNAVVSTLAGNTQAYNDGTGTSASFNSPMGVAVNSSGIVYVSDNVNQRIRRIGTDGVVSTVAGSGSIGSLNGTGTNASFNYPIGIAVNLSDIVYVTDQGSGNIRKINVGADPNIYSGTPITGTLLTTFNPALTGSTITIPASTTNAKVASFTVAASSLPLKTSVTGVWSVTLYATVGLSTSPASFYFEIVDGATTVATGTTFTSVNQSSPMQIYKSNLTIPARTYTTNLTLNIYVTTQASSSLILGFNGSTISYLNTTIPSVGVTGTTGHTGPIGSPLSFDGGTPSISFQYGPVFDCGSVE